MEEPLEDYLSHFEESRQTVEELLETTVDLSELRKLSVSALADLKLQEAVRYLAGPPISLDDLKVVAQARLSYKALNGDSSMAARVIDTVLLGLDRERFPWVSENREPTEAERHAAVVGTSSLIASRRVLTARANEAKGAQESRVKEFLVASGFSEVPTRKIATLTDAPEAGYFCGESPFGSKKADIIVRMWDNRVMPIECKVSNSSTNSVKRLNGDAAIKAVEWLKEFGTAQIVPAAVLAGVFNRKNLEEAQDRGLVLWWSHDIEKMIDWIDTTRR